MIFTAEDADFSVAINPQKSGGRCAAQSCNEIATLTATLAYCFCDADPEEHGHPGSPDATRDEVVVCEKHGAIIAHTWQSCESLRNFKAATS